MVVSSSLVNTLKSRGVTVSLEDTGNSSTTLRLKSETQSIIFEDASTELWERFLEHRTAEFFDMMSVLNGGDLEPLLITPSRAGFVWLASAVRSENGEWEGMLAECPRLKDIDTSYVLRMGWDDQHGYLRKIFSLFMSWLPEGAALRNASHSNAVLTARVAPEELWFLRIPIAVYACSSDFPLRQYRSVEYIVTRKSFAQYRFERQQTETALRDLRTLLGKTVVIINTYERLRKVPRAECGTELLLEVLPLFRSVTVDEEELTLRWYSNPDRETLSAILEDKSVEFIFANFESGGGKWEVGQGLRHSWKGKSDSVKSKDEGTVFDLTDRRYDLSHVRLMRVYHCNAAYRHADALSDGRNPADEHSIVHQLLIAGAVRVEGGLTQESHFDFLDAVIRVLLSPKLIFVMEMKCWQEGKDFNDLVRRLKEFAPDAM